MPNLTLGISPCPNDTFIFEGWVTGLLANYASPQVQFADVQNLNELAQNGQLDVVKVSCGNLNSLEENYQILGAGGAMGFGCGPLLLQGSPGPFDPEIDTWLPGKNTTAALLFEHWNGGKAKVRYALFDEVYRALCRGEARQGVVIHEHRFTFARDGLHCIQDLGAHWEATMHSPIPLGVIVAKRSLGIEKIKFIEGAIRASLANAWSRPNLITPFIREHAQDTDSEVMEQHIRMFVNSFSEEIGEAGYRALGQLQLLAKVKVQY